MGWFSKPSPKIYTGRVLTHAEVRTALGAEYLTKCGKLAYAEVASAAVVWLAQQARDALFREGNVTKWSKTATCTLYASRFVSRANELFFNAAFHDRISAQLVALAAGECWFTPEGSRGDNHAIGVCLTERGPLYIDPQVPDVLRPMSSNELIMRQELRFL